MTKFNRVVWGVSIAALSIVVISCGSSDDSGEGTSADSAPRATDNGAAETSAAEDGATGTSTPASGSAAAGSDEPLKIGFASMESGTISFPGMVDGAAAAQAYINDELQGIHGRPVELVTCDLQNSAQGAQTCGQQFAADPDILFVLYTLDPFTGPAFMAPLQAAGKPVLGSIATTVADATAAGAYFVYPGSYEFFSTLIDFIGELPAQGLHDVAILHEDEQSANEGFDRVVAETQDLDVNLKVATMDPASADFVSQLTATDAASADMLFVGGTSECPAVAKNMQTLNIAPEIVLTNNQCLSPQALAADPTLYEGWLVNSTYQSPDLGRGKNEDVDNFLDSWETYGTGAEIPALSQEAYGLVLAAHDILESVDTMPATSAEIADTIFGYDGHVPMGGTMNCPGPTESPNDCSSDMIQYQVTDGVYDIPAGD